MNAVQPGLPPPDEPIPTETSAPNEDLADRRPGQGIAEQAQQLRRTQPVLSALRRVLRIYVGDGAYRKGAKGERLVAKRLAKLGDAWHVLHSIPIGDGGTDIDHVVIGPGGVFTLNAKNHLGHRVWVHTRAFRVDGVPKNEYLRASRSEAEKASRRLSAACGFPVLAVGVIVVLADDLTIEEMPEQTPVIARKRIAHWLSSQPVHLGQSEVQAIFEAARSPSTWN
jgi:hypothetical protein